VTSDDEPFLWAAVRRDDTLTVKLCPSREAALAWAASRQGWVVAPVQTPDSLTRAEIGRAMYPHRGPDGRWTPPERQADSPFRSGPASPAGSDPSSR